MRALPSITLVAFTACGPSSAPRGTSTPSLTPPESGAAETKPKGGDYTPEIYPTRYWSLWSDAIIHHMQMRVLGQIKHEAELNARASN